MSFEIIKSNYDKGLWNKQMVRVAVGLVITEAQYKLITGEDF